jgi:hypothetical protein
MAPPMGADPFGGLAKPMMSKQREPDWLPEDWAWNPERPELPGDSLMGPRRAGTRDPAMALAFNETLQAPPTMDETLGNWADQDRIQALAARRYRDMGHPMGPAIGMVTAPLNNLVTDRDRRREFGEMIGEAGDWLVENNPISTERYFFGDAERYAEAVRGAVRGVQRLPSQIAEATPSALRSAGNALESADAWLEENAPETLGEFVGGGVNLAAEYGPDILRAITYGPWENEDRLQSELERERARYNRGLSDDREVIDELAGSANAETGWAALNAAFAPGDVAFLSRLGRREAGEQVAREVADDAPRQSEGAPATSRYDDPIDVEAREVPVADYNEARQALIDDMRETNPRLSQLESRLNNHINDPAERAALEAERRAILERRQELTRQAVQAREARPVAPARGVSIGEELDVSRNGQGEIRPITEPRGEDGIRLLREEEELLRLAGVRGPNDIQPRSIDAQGPSDGLPRSLGPTQALDAGNGGGGQNADNVIQGSFRQPSEREREAFIRQVQGALTDAPQSQARIGQAYHERGLLPLPIGTRMRGPVDGRGRPPGGADGWRVDAYYVRPFQSDDYGYVLRRGDETIELAVHYPRTAERAGGPNSSRPDVISGWQAMLGPEGADPMRALWDARQQAALAARRAELDARPPPPPLSAAEQAEWDLLDPAPRTPDGANTGALDAGNGGANLDDIAPGLRDSQPRNIEARASSGMPQRRLGSPVSDVNNAPAQSGTGAGTNADSPQLRGTGNAREPERFWDDRLSDQQNAIVRWALTGRTNQQIADAMLEEGIEISPNVVAVQLNRLRTRAPDISERIGPSRQGRLPTGQSIGERAVRIADELAANGQTRGAAAIIAERLGITPQQAQTALDTARWRQRQASRNSSDPLGSIAALDRQPRDIEARGSLGLPPQRRTAAPPEEPLEARNIHGLEPALRVRAPVDPEAPVRPKAERLTQETTNANSGRQIAILEDISRAHPNGAASVEDWGRMWNDATGNPGEVPAPPYAFMNETPEQIRAMWDGLTPEQVQQVDAGLAAAARMRAHYRSGNATVEDTGRVMMWSMLSRGVSPFPHESAFLAAFDGIDPWIERAARGAFTEADLPAYIAWSKGVDSGLLSREGNPIFRGGVNEGLPGAGSTHNLNSFGEDFLLKMGRPDANGVTPLQRLHDMIASDMSGPEIRREFLRFGQGVGIDNKVVSFTLLVTGRDDVMVLDRVQIRRLWGADEYFGGRNLYDPIKVNGRAVTGTSLADITYGSRGLMIYEALERVLANRLGNQSIGRYHWGSWLSDSGQEASHGSLDAVLRRIEGANDPLAGVTAREGQHDTFGYGTQFGINRDTGAFFHYTTPQGDVYEFGPAEYRAFINEVKRPGSRIVPPNFRVTDATGQAWWNQPGVDQVALGHLAARRGRFVERGVQQAADGNALAGGPARRPNLQPAEEVADRRARRSDPLTSLAAPAAIGAGGLGALSVLGGDAKAQDMTAAEALDAYGYEQDYFGPSWRVVAPRGGIIPSWQTLDPISVQDEYVILRDSVTGRLFYGRSERQEAGGEYMDPASASLQILGELEPTGEGREPSVEGRRIGAQDKDWSAAGRPILAAGIGALLASRIRGRPRVAGTTAVTAGLGADYLMGGEDAEPVLAAAGALGLRFGVPAIRDNMAHESFIRSEPFRAQRDAFADMLSDIAPVERAMNPRGDIPMGAGGLRLEVPQAEVVEQGLARNLEATAPSPREQFLELPPAEQYAWMERENERLAGRMGRLDEAAAGARERRLGPPAPPALPDDAFPIGFYDPRTGEPLFGSAGRRPPPRQQRRSFDELSPSGQARRVGSASQQVEAARELGVGEFQTGAAAMRAIRERASADPSFMQMLRERYPVIAAAILGGATAGQIMDELAPAPQ